MVSCLYTNKSSSSYSLSSHTFKQGGVVNISECTLVIAQRLLASNTFSWQAHAGEPEASVLPHPHISRTAGLHWFPTESIKQHNVKKDGLDLKLLIALLAAIVLAGLIWLAWHFYSTKRTTTATPSSPTTAVEMMPSASHDTDPLLDQDGVVSEPEGYTCAICLSGFEAELKCSLPCKHDCLHRSCIERWMPINPVCPVCIMIVQAMRRRAESWWLCDSIMCWCSNCLFTGYVESTREIEAHFDVFHMILLFKVRDTNVILPSTDQWSLITK